MNVAMFPDRPVRRGTPLALKLCIYFLNFGCGSRIYSVTNNTKRCLDNEDDRIVSLGYRQNVQPRNPVRQTREKVCVWCVFELHTHNVSVQKLTF